MIIVVGLLDHKTGKKLRLSILLRGRYMGVPTTPTCISDCDLYQSEGNDHAVIYTLLARLQEKAKAEGWGDTSTIHCIPEGDDNLSVIDYVFERQQLRQPEARDCFPKGLPPSLGGRRAEISSL